MIAVAQRTIAQTRSIGIGLSSCTIPAVGKANFHIADGSMEVGIGHHGEPGIAVSAITPAATMARTMVEAIVGDLPFRRGDRVAVLISGLGATPLMEQYILYGSVAELLAEAGIDVVVPLVGNFFTSLEMMGVTLSVLKLDEDLESAMRAPCASIGLKIQGVQR